MAFFLGCAPPCLGQGPSQHGKPLGVDGWHEFGVEEVVQLSSLLLDLPLLLQHRMRWLRAMPQVTGRTSAIRGAQGLKKGPCVCCGDRHSPQHPPPQHPLPLHCWVPPEAAIGPAECTGSCASCVVGTVKDESSVVPVVLVGRGQIPPHMDQTVCVGLEAEATHTARSRAEPMDGKHPKREISATEQESTDTEETECPTEISLV